MEMSIDECFEFDYHMQMDEEARKAQEREDREDERESSRNSRSSGSFYVPKNTPTNTNNVTYNTNNQKQVQPKTNWGCLIFLIIILICIVGYYINEAYQNKRRDEWRADVNERKVQEMEVEENSGYEEIPENDLSYEIESFEKIKPSPYDGCSYIGDDGEWHKCESNVVAKNNSEEINQLDNEYIPEAQIPVAQIPTATIPKSQTPKSQTTSSWKDKKETYYNEYTDEYFDNYDDYYSMLGIEEYRKRGYDSYDDYYRDYFDKNKGDNFSDYYDVYADYDDYGGNYDFADFRDDFYDDHYGEYF